MASSVRAICLRATVESVLAEHGERFCEAVAALGMHHAFRHGLLEHTLRMAKCAEALLPLYPKVDHSLSVAGIVLHDMGKVQEYSRLEPGMAKAGDVLENWIADFDYMQKTTEWGVLTFTCHPFISGRGHRIMVLDRLIQQLKREGAVFMRVDEAVQAFKRRHPPTPVFR